MITLMCSMGTPMMNSELEGDKTSDPSQRGLIRLPKAADMRQYQRYIYELERLHNWLDVDLIHNCFLMGEEVGELFKSVRQYQKFYNEASGQSKTEEDARAAVAEELVDVLNYLIAIANRLNIDLETAFRKKNERNQHRSWSDADG